jgi:hypothetical protein
MNQISEVLATLIHYNVAVRDTLEYCLKKDKYDPNLFKEKKRSILVEVDQHTPLKDIIDHSGENGVKLEKSIREFYDKCLWRKLDHPPFGGRWLTGRPQSAPRHL